MTGPAERLAVLNGSGPTTQELVSAVRDGDTVIGESKLPGDAGYLNFHASNIRSERTGIHARIALLAGDGELGYDTFNIEKITDRTRLANQAAERLGDRKRWGALIRLRLDQFCSLVWPRFVQTDGPKVVVGRDLPAAKMLLAPYVTDSRTIFFAPGGSGKSWLALIWALHLHHGLTEPWRATTRTDVLYLDFEDTEDVFSSRLNQAARLLNCPAELPYYSAEGKGLSDVWDVVRNHTERYAVGLLIVDSISRLGLGKLVEDGPANNGVNLMNRLGVPWLALAHTPHHSGDHVFGSVHWENGARVVVKGESTQSPEDEGLIGLRLSITKANHIRRGQTTTWALRFQGDQLTEHRPAQASDFPDLSDTRPVRERIRDYLSSSSEADIEELCEWTESSDRTVRRALLDGEGTDFERISGGKGRGNKSRWRRLQVVP